MHRAFQHTLLAVATVILFALPSSAVKRIAAIDLGGQPVALIINPKTRLLYAANDLQNVITVIDTTTFTVVTHIPTAQPFGVAVNPNTNLIYANTRPGSVYVIDGATNQVVNTIPTGAGSGWIAVDPGLNQIYSLNTADNTVSLIDGGSNSVISTISVGQDPAYVVVDTLTHYVYVSNGVSGTVSVLDGRTRGLITTIVLPGSIPPFPNGSALDETLHRLYVTDNQNCTLDVIDLTTFAVTDVVGGFSSAHGVATNLRTHGIFVLDFGLTSDIHAVNPTTLMITSSTRARLPLSPLVDQDTGYLYLCATSKVIVFGP